MKKFIMFALAGVVALSNVGLTMAAAPAAPAAPAKAIAFAPISFEAAEAVLWTSGPTATGSVDVIANADGTKALKIDIASRAADWNTLTSSTINPPAGTVWSLTKYDTLKASVTNPNNFESEIRLNITDNLGNTRLTIFKIPANSTREIAIDKTYWGEPGVKSADWDAGYAQVGVDPSQIKAIRFYAAEPTPSIMEGQSSMAFIIDNIHVEKGVVPSGASFAITNIKPGKTEAAAAFMPLPKTHYEALLGKTLVGGTPPAFPNSMTVQLKKDGKNLATAADGTLMVAAGDTVTMHVQMFKTYALLGNAGTTNLDISLSSPKGIKILTPTNSQTFVDANPIGVLAGLNFDFVMPEGNVDLLNDFKWDFKLTPQ